MERVILNDGNEIPAVGFGVFLIPADGSTYEAVKTALKIGYRHIDTAAAYFNEEEVGRAVRDSGIPRDEIFVTSKLCGCRITVLKQPLKELMRLFGNWAAILSICICFTNLTETLSAPGVRWNRQKRQEKSAPSESAT